MYNKESQRWRLFVLHSPPLILFYSPTRAAVLPAFIYICTIHTDIRSPWLHCDIYRLLFTMYLKHYCKAELQYWWFCLLHLHSVVSWVEIIKWWRVLHWRSGSLICSLSLSLPPSLFLCYIYILSTNQHEVWVLGSLVFPFDIFIACLWFEHRFRYFVIKLLCCISGISTTRI